jgi:NAD(P)-dependent dehydrogenase (short-subunit alcohol dehydrogenase family)
MKKLSELHSLTDRVAVVTGGGGHIGLAISEALIELGARVVVVDRDEEATAARAAQLQSAGAPGALGIAADLAAAGAADRVVAETMAAFGRIDILVNNAAITGAAVSQGYSVPLEEQTVDAWRSALDVNLTAAFQLCQAARRPLEALGRGAIINVGSIYGVVGPNMGLYEGTRMGNPAAYAASKGALLQLTKYLATVLAPRIRVNAISPGGIERGQPAAFQERYSRLTPLARMGTEEDMKGAFAFLASDASAYVTGQNLMVDGGWTTW